MRRSIVCFSEMGWISLERVDLRSGVKQFVAALACMAAETKPIGTVGDLLLYATKHVLVFKTKSCKKKEGGYRTGSSFD